MKHVINISLLPADDRRDIELQRQASFLIHKYKKGKASRIDVNNYIDELPENERDKFRDHLNKFRQM